MPILPFEGNTFVAWTDISGFKKYMSEGDRAARAMDRFYHHGYHAIRRSDGRVEGLFVSDAGILFSKGAATETDQLQAILQVLRELNRAALRDDILLTTALAFGPFSYHDRIEFPGIAKQPVYGHAYVAAYLDQATAKPRLQAGQCCPAPR